MQMTEYIGLTEANLAWASWREERLLEAKAHGRSALQAWEQTAIADFPFKWTALFPLLAIAREENDLARAIEWAHSLLEPTQQPLPDPVTAALRTMIRAIDTGAPIAVNQALERTLRAAAEARLV